MDGPVPLSELKTAQEKIFGAKAVNLGLMIQAGLQVPDGFAIAFGIETNTPLVDEEKQAIRDAYHALANRAGARVPVAVRSSAAGEDSADATFAGQHETFLNLENDLAVLEAIGLCLESQKSDRAISYRRETGVAVGPMGVVVQQMVMADFAGVCFTRSPKAKDQIVVEAVRGLGETLVSGKHHPARICFTRDTLEAVSEDDFEGVLADLGRKTAIKVALQAIAAEEVFGMALDIEWVVKEGECFLLQARPITALDGETEREKIVREEIARLRELAGTTSAVWSDFSIIDMLPHPKPISTALFTRAAMYDGGIGHAFRRLGFMYTRSASAGKAFEVICGRPYINFNLFIGSINADRAS